MFVGGQDKLAPRKGAHEHKKGRTREMEVRKESVHNPEFKAGQDKEVRAPHACTDFTVLRHEELQSPSCSGSHSNNLTFVTYRVLKERRVRGANLVTLRPQEMILRVFSTNRQKSSNSDVKCDHRDLHTFCADRRKDFRREVEPRCRRRDGAGPNSIDRLITGLV